MSELTGLHLQLDEYELYLLTALLKRAAADAGKKLNMQERRAVAAELIEHIKFRHLHIFFFRSVKKTGYRSLLQIIRFFRRPIPAQRLFSSLKLSSCGVVQCYRVPFLLLIGTGFMLTRRHNTHG
ncbi:hypothetical protein J4198_005195, partial [Salmonella enterica]|nr:hypothetical protein [Salmonella enterica]EHG6848704.1 hypothetical protein [Salmonella enterica]